MECTRLLQSAERMCDDALRCIFTEVVQCTPLKLLALSKCLIGDAWERHLGAIILLAIRHELHVELPLCKLLCGGSAWLLTASSPAWTQKVAVMVCMSWRPAFPLDLGTPLGGERDQAARHENDADSVMNVARDLHAVLHTAAVPVSDEGQDLSTGLTQQMADASMETPEVEAAQAMPTDPVAADEVCGVCRTSMSSTATIAWPSCGHVEHRLHLACAVGLDEMRRALAHLSNTGDASRICQAPCWLCRQHWGEDERSILHIQTLCSAMESEGIQMPPRGCQCATCEQLGVGPTPEDRDENPLAPRAERLPGEPRPHAVAMCADHPRFAMNWETSRSRSGWRAGWACQHRWRHADGYTVRCDCEVDASDVPQPTPTPSTCGCGSSGPVHWFARARRRVGQPLDWVASWSCRPCAARPLPAGEVQLQGASDTDNFERRYGDSRAAEMPARFAAVVAAARRTNDPGHFVREYTWSAFVVPFIWMAAAAEAFAVAGGVGGAVY